MAILDGKLAIITHASSEYAPALAAELARQGARLAVVDLDKSYADALAANLPEAGAYRALLTQDSVTATCEAIAARQGQPDILVTCPPAPLVTPSVELSEADFRKAVDETLIHAFLWSKAVGRFMLDARQGVMVHVTGLSGMGGWRGWLAQSAAFGGVHNLAHNLAVEWAKSGVRVNCLVPGVTEATAQQITHSPQVIKRIPAERLATSDDLCRALLYLVSPGASFLSGEILRVDGGWDIWGRLYAVAEK